MKLRILPKYREVFAAGSLMAIAVANICLYLSTEIYKSSDNLAITQALENKQVIKTNEILNKYLEDLIEAGKNQITPKPIVTLFPLDPAGKVVKQSIRTSENVNREIPTLSMIMNDSKSPIALVNGKFYKLGQKISSGEKIIKIENESITLEDELKNKSIVKIKNIYIDKQLNKGENNSENIKNKL